MATFAGISREIPVRIYRAQLGLPLQRGMVMEFTSDQTLRRWLLEDRPFGVAVSDRDDDLLEIDVPKGQPSSSNARPTWCQVLTIFFTGAPKWGRHEHQLWRPDSFRPRGCCCEKRLHRGDYNLSTNSRRPF